MSDSADATRSLIVILGPTASGKTAAGVRLAKKFRGIVISADSRQVYRGLNVGTAKITTAEMRGVPHFLLDVASPRGQYSVARYVRDVRRVLTSLPITTPVFLVGGTPFYIRAVIEPNVFPPVPPDPRLRRKLENKTTRQLIAQLRRLNPARSNTVDLANRRRLIRAIEIAKTAVPNHDRPQPPAARARLLKIGLRVPRRILYRRIDRRVDRRLSALIREVLLLRRRGISWRRLESFGLEYRHIAAYLQGRISKPEAADRIKFGTHAFARRQLTWWRKDKDIVWISRAAEAEHLIGAFLQA